MMTDLNLRTQIVDLSDWFGFDPFGFLGISGNVEGNFLSAVSNVLTLVAIILFIVWIVMVAVASIRMITSFGNADKFGEGITTLKNLIIGIFLLFVFVVVLIIIARIFGA